MKQPLETVADIEALLAQANKQRSTLANELGKKKSQLHEADQKITSLKTRLTKARQMADAWKKPLRVSDHAKVRFLERVRGIDMSAVEAAILNPQMEHMIKTIGPKGQYPLGEFVAIVEDNTIVTVKPQ